MMDIFFKPAYGELQQAMAAPPADRKAWATIYQKAVRLAEMENLLFFRNHEDTRKPEWAATAARARQAAADVAAAALVGLRTVKPENYEAVRTRYPAVAETCNACHQTFARDAPAVKP
jgi:cytochrome c556